MTATTTTWPTDPTPSADPADVPLLPGGPRLSEEVTVHTWDGATATDQDPAWDEAVRTAVLTLPTGHEGEGHRAVLERSSAEMGLREVALLFADAVPVADDAPASDRLEAWSGRLPTLRRAVSGSTPSDAGASRR